MNTVLNALYNGLTGSDLAGYAVRIFLSCICGICIGWERKNRKQIIGIRTLLLICISSTLLGILSAFAATANPAKSGDPGRIAAAVVTGIGFVGGGAIMHRGFNVKGVTTAALIWATSAIGLSLGYGLYLPAILVFALIMIALPSLSVFESKFFPSAQLRVISLKYSGDHVENEKAESIIREMGFIIMDESFSSDVQSDTIDISFTVANAAKYNLIELNDRLKSTGNLVKFAFTES